MTSYSTITEALDDLKRRGYTADFDLQPHCVACGAQQIELHPEDFEITEVYRFEGANDPGDSNVVYAIAGKNGMKGVLVDAYGAYSDSLTAEMLEKLKIRH
jgi:hypothetical protein